MDFQFPKNLPECQNKQQYHTQVLHYHSQPCLLEDEKMTLSREGMQAYFPQDAEETLISTALICHSGR